jgi:hypothetical protein
MLLIISLRYMDNERDYSLPIRSQMLFGKIHSVYLFKSDSSGKKEQYKYTVS